jgi:hypothetical protein
MNATLERPTLDSPIALQQPRHRRSTHRVATAAAWLFGTLATLLTIHGVAAALGAASEWSTITEVEQRITVLGLGHYVVGTLLAYSLAALALVVRSR